MDRQYNGELLNRPSGVKSLISLTPDGIGTSGAGGDFRWGIEAG